MAEKQTIQVQMTKQEAWALARISAAVKAREDDDTLLSESIREDVLPFSWVGMRVFNLLTEELEASPLPK